MLSLRSTDACSLCRAAKTPVLPPRSQAPISSFIHLLPLFDSPAFLTIVYTQPDYLLTQPAQNRLLSKTFSGGLTWSPELFLFPPFGFPFKDLFVSFAWESLSKKDRSSLNSICPPPPHPIRFSPVSLFSHLLGTSTTYSVASSERRFLPGRKYAFRTGSPPFLSPP